MSIFVIVILLSILLLLLSLTLSWRSVAWSILPSTLLLLLCFVVVTITIKLDRLSTLLWRSSHRFVSFLLERCTFFCFLWRTAWEEWKYSTRFFFSFRPLLSFFLCFFLFFTELPFVWIISIWKVNIFPLFSFISFNQAASMSWWSLLSLLITLIVLSLVLISLVTAAHWHPLYLCLLCTINLSLLHGSRHLHVLDFLLCHCFHILTTSELLKHSLLLLSL